MEKAQWLPNDGSTWFLLLVLVGRTSSKAAHGQLDCSRPAEGDDLVDAAGALGETPAVWGRLDRIDVGGGLGRGWLSEVGVRLRDVVAAISGPKYSLKFDSGVVRFSAVSTRMSLIHQLDRAGAFVSNDELSATLHLATQQPADLGWAAVLVDEVQDLSLLRLQLCRALASDDPMCCSSSETDNRPRTPRGCPRRRRYMRHRPGHRATHQLPQHLPPGAARSVPRIYGSTWCIARPARSAAPVGRACPIASRPRTPPVLPGRARAPVHPCPRRGRGGARCTGLGLAHLGSAAARALSALPPPAPQLCRPDQLLDTPTGRRSGSLP